MYDAPAGPSRKPERIQHHENKKPSTIQSETRIAIPGSNRAALPQARLLGKSDPGSKIKISIYARQNPAGAAGNLALLEEMNRKLPAERHYLNEKEFKERFAADPEDLQHIKGWAKASGLKVLEDSAAKCRVRVEGTIGSINKALGIQLNEYEHPELGRFRGRGGQIHVPAELCGVVQGVSGWIPDKWAALICASLMPLR